MLIGTLIQHDEEKIENVEYDLNALIPFILLMFSPIIAAYNAIVLK